MGQSPHKSGCQTVEELEGRTGILGNRAETQLIQGQPGMFLEVFPKPGLFSRQTFFRGIRLETTRGKEKIQGLCAGFHRQDSFILQVNSL